MTTNEKLLRDAILELQTNIQDISMYLTSLHQTIQSLSVNIGSYPPIVHSFYNVQQVIVPCGGSINESTVGVYVETSTGSGIYRMATPALRFTGSSVELTFDVNVSGYVVENTIPTVTGIPMPCALPYYSPTANIALVEEEPVQQQMDVKTPNHASATQLESGSADYNRAMKHIGIE